MHEAMISRKGIPVSLFGAISLKEYTMLLCYARTMKDEPYS
jgi:hypothetical protein